MDKRTIIAFLLIGAILVLTQTTWYKKEILGLKELPPQANTLQDSDTAAKSEAVGEQEHVDISESIKGEDLDKMSRISTENKKPLSSMNNLAVSSAGQEIYIHTSKYEAVLNTKGATVSSWKLKDYYYDENLPVQLIKKDGIGNLGIQFAVNQDTIKTYDFVFDVNKTAVDLTTGKTEAILIFELTIDDNRVLKKTYTFYNDKYIFDLKIELINLGNVIDNQKYTLTWLSGLEYTEKNIGEDAQNSKSYIYTGGGKEEFKLPEKPNISESTEKIEGKIDWVAIRTKYFASIIFPKTDDDISARLAGTTEPLTEKKVAKTYQAFLEMRIPYSSRNTEVRDFQVFLGPLDYHIVKQYDDGFDKIMGYGPAIIRPFSKLTIRVFRFLHGFIPNYGVVLIVFSILVKIVVYPLTRKSYIAMREMQKLQPLMTEMREKYKNEPQRLNKEMMVLYKEHGVNPLSGCLPTLLQMPLLWSIFLVFRNTIQLRHAEFIWWINDLSSPDTILLPFSLPLIGNSLHIIPLLMGATMFFQQKMTMKDPKQKAMVYFMPIFLTFIFYNFPSGLNLYYTLFNLFSMLQQRITPEKHNVEDVQSNMSKTANKKSKK